MDIKITYETLFEILRREKGRDDLQKLDVNFFSDVVDYLKEKENLILRQKTTPNLFSFEDEKKNDNQLTNIKKIIKELYERREKKIINSALNRSITNSNLIDTSSLLPEEKKMFEELVGNLNKFRFGILNKILQTQLPGFEEKKNPDPIEKTEPDPDETKSQTEENGNKIVRFIHSVPRFLGKELETYGPFEAEEIATLPSEIANVLIEKKRAEEIEDVS